MPTCQAPEICTFYCTAYLKWLNNTRDPKNWAQHGTYRPTTVWPLRPVDVKNLAASSEQAASALANPRGGHKATLPGMLHCQAERPRFIPNVRSTLYLKQNSPHLLKIRGVVHVQTQQHAEKNGRRVFCNSWVYQGSIISDIKLLIKCAFQTVLRKSLG